MCSYFFLVVMFPISGQILFDNISFPIVPNLTFIEEFELPYSWINDSYSSRAGAAHSNSSTIYNLSTNQNISEELVNATGRGNRQNVFPDPATEKGIQNEASSVSDAPQGSEASREDISEAIIGTRTLQKDTVKTVAGTRVLQDAPKTVTGTGDVQEGGSDAVLDRGTTIPSLHQKDMNMTSQMTRLLNKLLLGYDKKLRPNMQGKPVVVLTDISLRSMGPISEREMQFSIDCYLRQKWRDPRLALSNISLEWVPLSIHMLERIWHPDTVFHNGRHSYHHVITTPNKFLRIERNGTLLFSQRLTVLASCPMNLENFPMDTQECPLVIGSFGYTKRDVIYKWRFGNENSVDISPTVTLSQFELVAYPTKQMVALVKGSHHSLLHVKFRLRRRMGYFLIQVYVPCGLLVVLSWVSFWINREATSDRIALGVMTVLTMTFFALDSRRDLPRVPYATALDLYVVICYAFVLSVVPQFACVHKFTKLGSGEIFPEADVDDSDSSDWYDVDEDEETQNDEPSVVSQRLSRKSISPVKRHAGPMKCSDIIPTDSLYDSDPRRTHSDSASHDNRFVLTTEPPKLRREESRYRRLIGSIVGSFRNKTRDEDINSVSKIDTISRRLFPLFFAIFNFLYWGMYYSDY